MTEPTAPVDFDAPFPLKRNFGRRVVPVLATFVAVLVGLAVFGARATITDIYLELAQTRAESIAADVQAHQPEAWAGLLTARDPIAYYETAPGAAALFEAMRNVSLDSRVTKFKLYNVERVTLYSNIPGDIGRREDQPALDPVFRDMTPAMRAKSRGTSYELYVPILDDAGTMVAVMELYEDRTFLDAIMTRTLIPAVVVPLSLSLILFGWLWMTVGAAQDQIDARAALLGRVHKRLERFVSGSAVDAVLNETDAAGAIPPRRIAATLLYSDIRSFTSLAETSPPKETVEFLNRLMSLQIAIVGRHDGDVDKLIGDAVLARFEGADAETRAVAAAQEILAGVKAMDPVRGVGIGVHAGDVIACTVGDAERQDFTIIGDSVNVSARLCSAAAEGELVVDARTLRHAAVDDTAFAEAEVVSLKGREETMEIRRWRA